VDIKTRKERKGGKIIKITYMDLINLKCSLDCMMIFPRDRDLWSYGMPIGDFLNTEQYNSDFDYWNQVILHVLEGGGNRWGCEICRDFVKSALQS